MPPPIQTATVLTVTSKRLLLFRKSSRSGKRSFFFLQAMGASGSIATHTHKSGSHVIGHDELLARPQSWQYLSGPTEKGGRLSRGPRGVAIVQHSSVFYIRTTCQSQFFNGSLATSRLMFNGQVCVVQHV